LRRRLRQIVARPEVVEALYVASPDLVDRLSVWDREPAGDATEKIERALVRYFLRMAARPTPFGLFAGCSVGRVGSRSRLVLKGRENYRRHTRLDMDYVVGLAQALAQDSEIRATLAVTPNSSLYSTPGRVCYAEVRRNGDGWTHHKVALSRSDYLDATIARSRHGASPDALATGLVDADPEATFAEARDYISELVGNQVLVSELIPPLTGPEPIHGLIARLPDSVAGECLQRARSALDALDAEAIGASPDRYRAVTRDLQNLPAKVEPGRLFQVDMVKPVVEATIGSAVTAEVLRGVQILQRLARPRQNDPLARFREKFVARYEGREVPLVEALDHEIGIGFNLGERGELESSSLLEGLTFPQPDGTNSEWGKREAALLRLLTVAWESGSPEISLSPSAIEELSSADPLPLPDAFAAHGTIAASSPEAIDKGEFRVLIQAASGPSGARLLGRFCHADPTLEEFVQEHLNLEEALHPDVIFAEVVHLPESRLGNILARPVLRSYEIPYLGRSSLDIEHQIPIDELLVAVVGDEMVLRSARLGRRVIPRLTSAHNFHASHGTYQFLCSLQGQGTAQPLAWDWGPLGNAPRLPRVVCGRLVLSRAVWRLSRDELKSLGDSQGAARFQAMQQLRTRRQLPRWVSLTDGDNELPIDLDNVSCVETLVELVKARNEAVLSEVFPAWDQLVVSGPEGRFAHEFVMPFQRICTPEGTGRNAGSRNGQASARRIPVPGPLQISNGNVGSKARTSTRRSFAPGSEWLYVKFYSGQATADQLLRDAIRPVADEVSRSGLVDGWYFIRYGDPDWHVRVRLHGDPVRLQAEVLPLMEAAAAPFLADGRIWRLQLDTYEREVERYGGDEGILLAEQLFHADSLAVLELLSVANDARAEVRWHMAVAGIDRLLVDLGLDVNDRFAVMKVVAPAFAREFRVDAALRKQISDKYRDERRELESLLEGTGNSTTLASSIAPILSRRSARLQPVAKALKALEQSGRLERPLADLAASFVHMHVNRLFPSAHRAQELVLYDFLRRNYESRLARNPPGLRQTSVRETIARADNPR
jgi:thiopeptide-type bacteriocin biosynthesis protein